MERMVPEDEPRLDAALRASEARLRLLIEQVPAVVWTTDAELRHTSVRGAGLEALGLRSEDVVGTTIYDAAESTDPKHLLVAPSLQALTGESMTVEFAFRGRTLHAHVEPLRDATGTIIGTIGVSLDISERVQAEAALRQKDDDYRRLLEQQVAERTRELSTVLEISRTIASTLELQPLLGLFLEQLRFVADYGRASVGVVEGEELVTVGSRAPAANGQPDDLTGVRYPLARIAPIWEVIRRREPVILADLHADGPLEHCFRAAAGAQYAARFGDLRAWLAVPLMLKDRVIGLLALSSTTPGAYTPRHAELVMAIASQAAIAIENARLYQRAQQAAALEERQRLARELHDSVSQALYGIVLGAQTARTLLHRNPGQVAEPLDYVLDLAEAGLAEMRALIFELRPESLQTEGLVVALTKHAAALRARYEIEVATALGEEPELPLEVKEAVYRIAQEALHNIVKHAAASRVDVRLACEAGRVGLEVRDDGIGFEPGSDFPGHLGLTSMRERAARVGGALEVESTPGRGTTIRARVPYLAEESGPYSIEGESSGNL